MDAHKMAELSARLQLALTAKENAEKEFSVAEQELKTYVREVSDSFYRQVETAQKAGFESARIGTQYSGLTQYCGMVE